VTGPGVKIHRRSDVSEPFIYAQAVNHCRGEAVGLPRDRTLRVRWTRLPSVTKRSLWASDAAWKRSVYVIADGRKCPLYIGKATGSQDAGFGNRYWGDDGAMAALAHRSQNRLYIGKIVGKPRKDWYEELERELIARQSAGSGGRNPRYNERKGDPDPAIRLRHEGTPPKLC
jgi:hypothetical protein